MYQTSEKTIWSLLALHRLTQIQTICPGPSWRGGS